MIGNKKIAKDYAKMLALYPDPVEEDKFNCYKCIACGYITKSIDRDVGIIPFHLNCDVCGEHAHSTFYTDIVKDRMPTVEWFRPSLSDVQKIRNRKPELVVHVLSGGLVHRKIKY